MALVQDDGQLRGQVAEEVRALMARRRISGVQLAKRIGRSQAYIWRRLSGETPFDVDDLQALAAVLEVNVVDLFGTPVRPSIGVGADVDNGFYLRVTAAPAPLPTRRLSQRACSNWTQSQPLEILTRVAA